MSKWKPMATAPKDEPILAFEPVADMKATDPEGWIGRVFYDTEDDCWMAETLATERHEYPGVYMAIPCEPSHWMPLPAFPGSDPDSLLAAWLAED